MKGANSICSSYVNEISETKKTNKGSHIWGNKKEEHVAKAMLMDSLPKLWFLNEFVSGGKTVSRFKSLCDFVTLTLN